MPRGPLPRSRSRDVGVTRAGDRRRTAILGQAAALLDEGSFHDLTMDAVAERVGVAKSTLYHYFATKDDVLVAVTTTAVDDLLDGAQLLVESDRSSSEIVREVLRDNLEGLARAPGTFRVLFGHSRVAVSPVHERAVRELQNEYLLAIADIVERGVDAGEFRSVDPIVFARSLLGMIGHSVYWLRPDGSLTPDEVALQFWKLLMFGRRQITGDEAVPAGS